MMGVEFEVTDPGLVDAYEYLCRHVPEFVNTVTNAVANRVGPQILADFQQEPGAVKTPIEWTSSKQRRYVMMQKRRGLIGPRTHALSKGYVLTVVYTPGEMTSLDLTNPTDYLTFVVGLRQQRFHANTGWYFAPDKAEIWQEIFLDEMETGLVKAFYAVDDVKRRDY